MVSPCRALVLSGLLLACSQGRSVVGGAPGGAGAADVAAPPVAVDDGLTRRLTDDEIAASWRDLLGDDHAPDAAALPADPVVRGFANNAGALLVSTAFAEAYGDAVARVVSRLDWQRDLRPRLAAPCTPAAADDACMRAFVGAFGRRIYRRPLAAGEVERFLGLARGAPGDTNGAAQLVLAAMLQSPHFLYLVDALGPAAGDAAAPRLGGYALAARLSFLLWGTTPTDALLDQAAGGALDTDDGLRGVAVAMLADARARLGLQRFFRRWLRYDETAWIVRAPGDNPQWRPEMRGYFAEETARFVDDLAWRDGASFLDLVSARWTFVNAPLAGLYGLPAGSAPADGWARVTFGPDSERSGVLTHASFLAITSWSTLTSATRRGDWVRGALLCEQVGSPPPVASGRAPQIEIGSVRALAAQHAANPACAGCHARLDPVGFGLERFDSIGAHRVADGRAGALTGDGRLEGFDPPEFTGAVELGARIRASEAFPACVAAQLFRYALRRAETPDDADALARLTARFRDSGYRFPELVLALVLDPRFRAPGAGAVLQGAAP